MKNLIFIGLPGCGKTSVSRLVADRLGRQWYDSDAEIERREGRSIPELFARKGESYFRQRETECIADLTRMKNTVIAVGGGAVVNNAALIKENAVVVFIDRSVEDILSTLEPGTRPLLDDPQKLYELRDRRGALYRQTCDFVVKSAGNAEKTAQSVIQTLKNGGVPV